MNWRIRTINSAEPSRNSSHVERVGKDPPQGRSERIRTINSAKPSRNSSHIERVGKDPPHKGFALVGGIFGLPERIRTVDLQSRSLTRYPAVPRVEMFNFCSQHCGT